MHIGDINPLIFWLAIIALVIGFWLLVFLMLRRSWKKAKEDLGYTRHAFIIWCFTPFFRLYFWVLERLGKLQIKLNGHIPWEGGKLVFVFNHPFAKLQDTFLLPIIIFYLKSRHYLNPVRYFPVLVADEYNFGDSPLFEIIGKTFFVTVNRRELRTHRKGSFTLEQLKKRFEEIGTIYAVFFPEGGRTLSADKNRKTLRVSQEGSRLAVPLEKGAARLALELDAPVVVGWSGGEVSERLYAPGPATVLLGLGELLFRPRSRLKIDIGHPDGPLRPMVGEDAFEFTQKIENKLLELGDYQSKRYSGGGK